MKKNKINILNTTKQVNLKKRFNVESSVRKNIKKSVNKNIKNFFSENCCPYNILRRKNISNTKILTKKTSNNSPFKKIILSKNHFKNQRPLNFKKRFCAIIFLFLFSVILFGAGGIVFADDTTSENDLEQQLEDSVNEQISSINFDELQDILDSLSSQAIDLFGSSSFWDKVGELINGDFGEGYTSFFSAIISVFFEEVMGFMPLLATIVIVTLLCSMIGNLRSKEGENGVGQVIDFVCFGVVVVLVSAVVIGLLNSATAVMSSMQEQMNVLFPILLTFLASVGGAVSVSIFQPAVAILSGVIVQVFMTVIVPLFVFLFVFIIINNLSPSVKLNKFISLISSIFKWIAGVCFSVFLGILAIQGIVAGSFDSVSIRATRFAIKSYVPILGGYLSDGFNIVMASSVLIKNAVGVAGIILLFISILSPVITIIACSLLLKLTSAILEPIGENSRIPEFLQQVAKTLNLLIMMILGVAFVYVITVGMILCTANVF